MTYECFIGCRWVLATYTTTYCSPKCDGWGRHPLTAIIRSVTCPRHRYHCRLVTNTTP